MGFILTPDPTTARAARLVVRDALDGQDEAVVFVAELLTSEIVTYAVILAQSEALLDISIGKDRLRVSVSGLDPAAALLGMKIVAELASGWGVQREHDRKTAWFELDLTTTA